MSGWGQGRCQDPDSAPGSSPPPAGQDHGRTGQGKQCGCWGTDQEALLFLPSPTKNPPEAWLPGLSLESKGCIWKGRRKKDPCLGVVWGSSWHCELGVRRRPARSLKEGRTEARRKFSAGSGPELPSVPGHDDSPSLHAEQLRFPNQTHKDPRFA